MNHERPNGRPIHAECPLDTTHVCECDKLHDYWDGTDAALIRRIAVATRLDMRRDPCSTVGRGPDLDEWLPSHGLLEDVDLTVAEHGFWKESEFLRCRAGLNFMAGDLNYLRIRL